MIKPDIAIITNIAEAHIENFRSVKEIAKAKGEVLIIYKKMELLF